MPEPTPPMTAPEVSRARAIGALKRLSAREMPDGPQPLEAACDICGTSMPEDHRHLLNLEDRHMVCACESCWALRSGDAEYRPTGNRVLWLEDFVLPDEIWARFSIPIGLAFFIRGSGNVVAMYPSPAGATESELDLGAWHELARLNPVLETLEADAETLLVNRRAKPPQHVIAPTDEAYKLVGLIKANWQGLSGGPAVERVVAGFFEQLQARA